MPGPERLSRRAFLRSTPAALVPALLAAPALAGGFPGNPPADTPIPTSGVLNRTRS